MHESAALARLPPIDLIPRESVPKARRDQLAELKNGRQTVRGRIISGIVLTLVTGLFSFAYGVGAVFAWTNGAHMFFRLVCSIFSAGLLVANRFMLYGTFAAFGELGRLSVSPDLLRAARKEQALDDAVRAMNAKALDWNEAAALAEANGFKGRTRVRLAWHREDLERRRNAILAGLERFRPIESGVVAKALPPPSAWGNVVRIDLESR